MTHAIPRRVGAAILASALACAAAATFVYDLTVTKSLDVVVDMGGPPTNVYDIPAIGSTGMLTIDLAVDSSNAGDPIPPEGLDTSSLLTVSATFGNLTTGLDPNFAVINPAPERAQFRNGSSSSTLVVDLAESIATGTLAGRF